MSNEYKGRISIGRVHCGDQPDYMRIELTDEDSQIQCIEIKLSLQQFAEALTGRGHVECTFETRGLDLLGSVAEHKEELVPIPSYDYQRSKSARSSALARALKPYETDGWRARREDAENHHRFVKMDKDGKRHIQRISFDRWVPKATDETSRTA